ncbi:MAG: Ig-like domain-containing protein [Bacteroides sp.]|nr:Ig-like domain-containing protein [Bacteroides sp.]MCM1095849.1 Ig-like domain-containing protein [Terasakiella sp.]
MKKLLLAVVGAFAAFSASAADMLLWSGTQVVGYDGKPEITANQCSQFQVGGDILLSFTPDASASYYALGVIYKWGNFSWGETGGVSATATQKTFGPITESDLALFKSKGFAIMGNGVTLTKIEYKDPSGPVDPQQLLRDPVSITTESASIEFTYDAIVAAGGTVGGGIEVDYKGQEGKGFYVNFMHQGNDTNEYEWCEFSNLQIVETDGKSILVLNQSTMDELNTFKRTLIVQCGFVDVSSVRVILPKDMPEVADQITLDKTEMSLLVGETGKIGATVKPGGAKVTWSSSDEAVATVDAEGTVTAVAPGTAVITAATDKVSATCKVTVKEPSSIALDLPAELTLMLGDYTSFAVTTTPADAKVTIELVDAEPAGCVKMYKYNPTTSKPYYNGSVSAEAEGTATLRVYITGEPDVKAECKIISKDYTEPTIVFSDGENIGLDKVVAGCSGWSIYTKLMLPGGDEDWRAELQSMTSSDPKIAEVVSVDEYKAVVNFLAPGKVTLSAEMSSKSGDTVNGSCEIDVKAYGTYESKFDFYNGDWQTKYDFPAETIADFTAHNPGVDMSISAGKTQNITFTEGSVIKFAVTDPLLRIVSIKASTHSNYRGSVDLFDKVTASSGTIGEKSPKYNLWEPDAAEAETGVEEVSFTVTKEFANLVIWKVELRRYLEQAVTLDKTDEELATGTTLQLTATVAENCLPATLEWSSSDESIATVDQNGLVTTLQAFGTAVITAKYGTAEATCNIAVTEAAGIESIGTDASDAPAEYFNLQGVRVAADALAPGIYIMRQGSTVAKVLVK